MEVLKRQLILKKIIVPSDWKTIKHEIAIEFERDNYYAELKESEIFKERIENLSMIDEYVGTYFSQEYVKKKILQFTDEDIKAMDKQMKGEPDQDVDADLYA